MCGAALRRVAMQLSKMLISSPEFKCSNEAASIAAMLSVPNVFMRPRDHAREVRFLPAVSLSPLFLPPPSFGHIAVCSVGWSAGQWAAGRSFTVLCCQ